MSTEPSEYRPSRRYPAYDWDIILEQKQILSQRGVLIHNVDAATYAVSKVARDAICCMNILQTSKDTWLPRRAIDLALAFHYEFLQREVKETVQVVNHHDALMSLFYGHKDEPAAAESDFATALAGLSEQPSSQFFDRVKEYEYTLWPIMTGDHAVPLILHQVSAVDDNNKPVARIDHVVIAEPYGEEGLPEFIWGRLTRIFTPDRGFAFAKPGPDPFWIPLQNDGFSCGLRCYEVLKTIMLRVNDALHAGRRDDVERMVWADMRADIQPDKIRAEMIGALAYMAMYHQDFDARLCVATFEYLPDPYGSRATRLVQRNSDEAQLLHGDLWTIQTPPGHPAYREGAPRFTGGGPRWE